MGVADLVGMIERQDKARVDTIGEECGDKHLTVVGMDVVRGISILHIVFTQNNSCRVSVMEYDTGSKASSGRQLVIPNCHTVEVAAFVKADDTVLIAVVSLYREAQRTIVQDLIALPAVGHLQLAVDQQAGRTTAECRTDVVRIIARAVIDMIRDAFLVTGIAVVDDKVGRVLHPYIRAE